MATAAPSIRDFQQRGEWPGIMPATLPSSLAPSVTRRGQNVPADMANYSAGAREVLLNSPFLLGTAFSPDVSTVVISNSLYGASTLVHAVYGPLNLYRAVRCPVHSGWDRAYQVGHGVTALAQGGLGFAYAAIRPASIGQVIATAQGNTALAASFGNVVNKAALAGGVACAALYAGAALEMGVKGVRTARLEKKSIAHLQELYKVDKNTLLDEMGAANLKSAARVEALAQQKERWQSAIQLANTHLDLKKKITISSTALEHVIEDQMTERGLETYGEKLYIQRRQAHNHERMKELVGSVAAKALAKAKADGKVLQADDPIVLKDIKPSINSTKWTYAKKCVLYTVGAVAIAMLCVYTAGAPFLIASVLVAATFTTEAVLSYRSTYFDTKASKDQTPSPPGKYDELFPKISRVICLAALVTTVAVTVVFGFPLMPLILTGGIACMWIGLNTYQLGMMDERKKKYIEFLLDRKEVDLQPIEFAYIAANGNKAQMDRAFLKLHENDRWEIQRIVNENAKAAGHFKNTSEELRAYRKAAEEYMLDTQLTWIQQNLLPVLKGRY